MTKLTITFFGQWYQLVETNRATLDILLKRGQPTKGSPINAERAAEPTQQFFMGKKNKLADLLPMGSVQTLKDIRWPEKVKSRQGVNSVNSSHLWKWRQE
jgi:hypothetical protein